MLQPQWPNNVRVMNPLTVTEEQLAQIAEMLGYSFGQSELLHDFANGQGVPGIMQYMRMLLQVALRHGWVTVIYDHSERTPVAAALWLAPGEVVSWHEQLSYAPQIAGVTGVLGLPKMLHDLYVLDMIHAKTMWLYGPHVFLLTVAVHPEYRGQSLSSALLHSMWRWCDQRKLTAYLESDDTDTSAVLCNSKLYARAGFTVQSEIPVWNAALRPRYLAMLRLPQR